MQRMTVAPLTQIILHWFHAEGGEAHCLARVYSLSDSAIVVLSELRSNDRSTPLMRDLSGAATALLPVLYATGIAPSTVTWLIQHGAFSDHEPLQQEEWAQVAYNWNGERYEVDWKHWQSLQSGQVKALSQTIELANVFDVLYAIDWMSP